MRFLLISVVFAACALAQVDEATMRRYNEILDRQHPGGRISQEERAFLMSVYPKIAPPKDSTGMIPLNDLGNGMYKGQHGGLYWGGQNTMPDAHRKAGMEIARSMRPLDGAGKPSPEGKFGLLSIGMSNTTMEYQTFMKRAAEEKGLNPRLALVDGAQNGQSAVETSDPKSDYWKVVDQRIAAAGMTRNQIQAAWLLQVVVSPRRVFPIDTERLRSLIVDTIRVARERLPNLKIVYLSSRIYAGYALVPQNPEPHSYESAFAVRWIVEDQIFGYSEYNFDPAKGRVRFPYVAWGPYMWADGVKGRKDGLKWLREDFGNDGMHPSNSGREKVARLLMSFLKSEPTAMPWFLSSAQTAAGQRRELYLKNNPPRASTGVAALSDLGTGKYKGEEGGLYPGGSNTIPAAHHNAGIAIAKRVVPLNAEGQPDANGKIVMLSIGFSNPNIEFPGLQRKAAADRAVNPKLLTVNGCVGGQASSVIADPNSNYWKMVQDRLTKAGVTAQQVQTIWLKEVVPGPSAPFPAEAKKLQGHLAQTLRNLRDKFPNVKLAFLSNRIYGGYTESGGSPEPYAYETSFAVKWVIADQIAGNADLNYDSSKGPVRAPWAAWAADIWTDGEKGRKDGLVFLREDMREDGLHPSDKGTAKVATLLLNFFKTDPTTTPWFLK